MSISATQLHIHRTLLRKSEVAEILACSLREIDRKRDEWGLRQIHLTDDPKSLRFLAEDVENFITRRMQEES